MNKKQKWFLVAGILIIIGLSLYYVEQYILETQKPAYVFDKTLTANEEITESIKMKYSEEISLFFNVHPKDSKIKIILSTDDSHIWSSTFSERTIPVLNLQQQPSKISMTNMEDHDVKTYLTLRNLEDSIDLDPLTMTIFYIASSLVISGVVIVFINAIKIVWKKKKTKATS